MGRINERMEKVENAENLDQLKKGVLAVFGKIETEIDYLWNKIDELNREK